MNLRVMHRWIKRSAVFVLPFVALLACVGLFVAIRSQIDGPPFLMAMLIFAAAFGTLAGSLLRYVFPFSITISQVAAP